MEKLIIPAFHQGHVLVYGDLMLDRYWYGATSRISPEAPVPVVCVNNMETRPGGAANVALNVAALGAVVDLFGWLGADEEGKELQRKLQTQGVNCHCLILPEYATVTKLRILSQNQQLIRLDFEKQMKNFDDTSLIENFKKQLASAHVAIFSDYAKGALHHVAECIQLARQQNVKVLVDPKHSDFSAYRDATLITPNRKEFEAVVGICHTDEDYIEKGKILIRDFNFTALLITLGKEGMLLLEQNQPPLKLPAEAREVYDVTGAGDTVIAVIGAALAAGASLEEAARLSNLAAGLVVRKLGASTVTSAELTTALCETKITETGVLTQQQLIKAITKARERGETIVMTNGCFDVLHAGHVEYLAAAKQLGDRLIVAVNDDASVKNIKGATRPLNPLSARMAVLSALQAVDWVVPFSETTPANLIQQILPDFLVKGGDYQPEEIAGANDVLANGGKVLVLPFKPGYSTSQLVEKIAAHLAEI